MACFITVMHFHTPLHVLVYYTCMYFTVYICLIPQCFLLHYTYMFSFLQQLTISVVSDKQHRYMYQSTEGVKDLQKKGIKKSLERPGIPQSISYYRETATIDVGKQYISCHFAHSGHSHLGIPPHPHLPQSLAVCFPLWLNT